MKPNAGIRTIGPAVWTALAAALAVGALGSLLYCALCSYTWGLYELMDYGVYTNMLWNTAHGDWFRYLVDQSYLQTHLSFSLALLAPCFRLWNHPALLIVVQWLMLAGGTAILCRTAHRLRVPPVMTAAIALFAVGYYGTQRTLMAEFHGLSTYFLLVPWLYHALKFRRRWSVVPLLLLLGIREDAFLFLLPLLVYMTLRDRWKPGWLLVGLAVAYGLLAIFFLYPHINGITLFARRTRYFEPSGLLDELGRPMHKRIQGLVLIAVPLLVCWSRENWRAWVLVSVAGAVCLLSRHPAQQSLRLHYSPPVMTMLSIGLVESMAAAVRRGGAGSGTGRMAWRSVGLVLAVLGAHAYGGLVFFGRKCYEPYMAPSLDGRLALHAAAEIPRGGVLLTERRLTAFTANRADLLAWNKGFDRRRHRFDSVFLRVKDLAEPLDGEVLTALERGAFGAVHFDGRFAILLRGGDPSGNAALLDAYRNGIILFAFTARHGGENRMLADGTPVRTWEGKGYRTPITLSYGGSYLLGPGRYRAVFRYRASPPERVYKNTWGSLSVHYLNGQGPALASRTIPPAAAAPGEWMEQALVFETPVATNIEVRATGGDAPLWLNRVTFAPAAEGAP